MDYPEGDNSSYEGFESPNLDEIVQDIFQLREPNGQHHHHSHPTGHSARCPSSSSSSSGSNGGEDDLGRLQDYPRRKTLPFLVRNQTPRPQVTLRYVQTIDGSLVAADSEVLRINDPDSMTLISRLRSNNDALLVGINTILRDNPSFAKSQKTQPVVLDGDLQTPLDCNLLKHPKGAWIFCRTGLENDSKKQLLIDMGARVFHVDFDSTDATATYLHLPSILEILYSQLGIQRLTVEGGVAILESFIISGLFDKVLIIISPSFGAGYALFQKRRVELARLPKLVDVRYEVLGRNLIMMAEPEIIFEAPQL